MKFKDIKEGDTVFIPEYVHISLRNRKTFYLEKEVTKVTKTQFTIEGGQRYNKTYGSPIGNASGYANLKDDKIFKDQTGELNKFKQKLGIEKEIQNELESLKLHIHSDCVVHLDALQEIYQKLIEIRKTVNSYSPF